MWAQLTIRTRSEDASLPPHGSKVFQFISWSYICNLLLNFRIYQPKNANMLLQKFYIDPVTIFECFLYFQDRKWRMTQNGYENAKFHLWEIIHGHIRVQHHNIYQKSCRRKKIVLFNCKKFRKEVSYAGNGYKSQTWGRIAAPTWIKIVPVNLLVMYLIPLT